MIKIILLIMLLISIAIELLFIYCSLVVSHRESEKEEGKYLKTTLNTKDMNITSIKTKNVSYFYIKKNGEENEKNNINRGFDNFTNNESGSKRKQTKI